VNSVIKFDIWGTIDDTKYWDECKKLIRRMPTNIQVRYCGIAEHSKVIEVLSRYDLFFLPTRGENYCHAIAEALMAGIPILISDQSPWRNLKADSVGWDLPITNGEGLFIEAIKETIKMDMRERMVLREKIIAYAEKHLSDSSVLEANRQVFTSSMQSLSCK
jgi:glycosyltransferase involved in cell wall biosynthesis